jgi:hypothetical protein
MAYWTMDVIMAFVPPVDMPFDLGLRMDMTTLLFAILVSMITGVVFGLAPALQASSSETVHALKEEGRSGSGGRTTGRLRNALVVAQVAVCLVLLVGATLFLRSFIAAQSLSPGFEPNGVVTASMDMFQSGYTGERLTGFRRRTIEAMTALPNVTAAAFGSRIPLGMGGNNSTSLGIDGYVPRENEEIVVNYSTVGPGISRRCRFRFCRVVSTATPIPRMRRWSWSSTSRWRSATGRRATRLAAGCGSAGRTWPKSWALPLIRSTAASTSVRCRRCSCRCHATASARCGCS